MPLGDIAADLRKFRKKLTEDALKARGTTAGQASVDPHLMVVAQPLLTQLGVMFDCCRTQAMNNMLLEDYY